jgi:arsenate reductase (thioredoxin)
MAEYNVLFLCTGNSARSIMAEALINHWGAGRFKGFSGGSFPKGTVHPLALNTLQKAKMPTSDLRSKSWDEFAAPNAPVMDFVFTVCDQARGEVCPVWPGHPVTAHWGIEDPAAVEGTDEEKAQAFKQTFLELDARIKLFTNLGLDEIDKLALQKHLDSIGESRKKA